MKTPQSFLEALVEFSDDDNVLDQLSSLPSAQRNKLARQVFRRKLEKLAHEFMLTELLEEFAKRLLPIDKRALLSRLATVVTKHYYHEKYITPLRRALKKFDLELTLTIFVKEAAKQFRRGPAYEAISIMNRRLGYFPEKKTPLTAAERDLLLKMGNAYYAVGDEWYGAEAFKLLKKDVPAKTLRESCRVRLRSFVSRAGNPFISWQGDLPGLKADIDQRFAKQPVRSWLKIAEMSVRLVNLQDAEFAYATAGYELTGFGYIEIANNGLRNGSFCTARDAALKASERGETVPRELELAIMDGLIADKGWPKHKADPLEYLKQIQNNDSEFVDTCARMLAHHGRLEGVKSVYEKLGTPIPKRTINMLLRATTSKLRSRYELEEKAKNALLEKLEKIYELRDAASQAQSA